MRALVLFSLFLLIVAQNPQFVPGGVKLETSADRVSGDALGANCDCTGSGAPVRPEVKKMLSDGISYIQSIESERSLGTSYEVLNKCIKLFGHDSCMNAEKSLRVTPRTVTLCIYDLKTGVNLVEDDTGLLQEVAKCKPDKVSSNSPNNQTTTSNSTSFVPSVQPSSSFAPSKPNNVKPVSPAPPKEPTNNAPPKAPTKSDPTSNQAPPTKQEPTSNEKPPAKQEPAKQKPAKQEPTKPEPVAPPTDIAATKTPSPTVAPPVTTPEPGSEIETISITTETLSPQATPSANEGCIAIEHLQGAHLQHRRHLTRRVLCARGVCATRNHALLIDGVYTSMGKLCETEETCISTTKLVNNLNVFRNRRWSIASGVVATPYDVRFPKFASFVAQSAEFMLYAILDVSGIIGLVVAVAVVLARGKIRG